MCKKLIVLGREFFCPEKKSESQDSKEIKMKKGYLENANKNKSNFPKNDNHHGHAARKK